MSLEIGKPEGLETKGVKIWYFRTETQRGKKLFLKTPSGNRKSSTDIPQSRRSALQHPLYRSAEVRLLYLTYFSVCFCFYLSMLSNWLRLYVRTRWVLTQGSRRASDWSTIPGTQPPSQKIFHENIIFSDPGEGLDWSSQSPGSSFA